MAGDLSSLDEPGQRFDQSTTLGGTVWKRSQGYIVISDNNGNRILAKCEDTNPDGDGSRVNLTNGGEADSGSDYYIYKDTGFSTANTPLTYDVYIGAAYVIPGYEGNFVILRVMINDDINDFASKSAYITSAQAVATQHVSSSQATSRSIDSASLLRYGRRPIDHAAQHIDTLFWARIQSDKRLALRGTQKSRLKYASNANYDYSNLWHSIWSELGDRIGLFYSEMGLTGKDYFLESQTTLVRDGGHVISSDTEGLET
jgi:hypothetical protein